MQVKILAALLALTAVPAMAEEASTARYQLISVSGGFVRLDMVTGIMTFCRDEVDTFRCAPIPTDTAKSEKLPGAGDVTKDESRLDRVKPDDNIDQDFDRALSMMDRAMRHFMKMSKENQKDCAL